MSIQSSQIQRSNTPETITAEHFEIFETMFERKIIDPIWFSLAKFDENGNLIPEVCALQGLKMDYLRDRFYKFMKTFEVSIEHDSFEVPIEHDRTNHFKERR